MKYFFIAVLVVCQLATCAKLEGANQRIDTLWQEVDHMAEALETSRAQAQGVSK